MATAKATKMDAQGRVMLPPHIRKELNLNPGQPLNVSLEGGTIIIRPDEKRCIFCGESVENVKHAAITAGHSTKRVCRNCAQAIVYATENKEEEK